MNILEDIEAERFKTEKTNKLLEAVNNELEPSPIRFLTTLRAPSRRGKRICPGVAGRLCSSA